MVALVQLIENVTKVRLHMDESAFILIKTEAADRRCFSKQVFLIIPQYLKENTFAGVSL